MIRKVNKMINKEFIGWSVFKSYFRVSHARTAILIWIIERIGSLLFFFRKRTTEKYPQSILIIQLDHIGDMILSSSLIASIKKTYPDAKISVLIRSLAVPIAEMIDGIDSILILHTPWLSREKNAGWIGVLQFCLQHFKSFDLVFEVHGEIRNNFIAWMLGKFRVGTSVRGGGFFLNKSISWKREYNLHICGMQTRMLDSLTGHTHNVAPLQIRIPETAKTAVAKLLQEKSLNSKEYVFIQMSTGGKNREWPLESWRTFIDKVISRKINVVCADMDQEKIAAVAPHSPLFHQVRVTLPEYAEFVRNAKVIVSVDTFCGHLASCFNIPTLSLYSGANIFDEWRPFSDNVEYLRDSSCPKFPCGIHTCIFGHYSPCMKKIDSQSVLDRFNMLWERS
ncbi:MAG: glycosyltransferase family 9 protein [Chitinispirillaceae bacterium]|nr:glycosyltransferase family 9 protein [Chitinispirillaceae bacterium]